MSVRAQAEVWARFSGKGADLLLAVAMADCADDEGASIYPSIETLAKKTRQSERTIQRQILGMLKTGWLVLVRQSTGRRGVTNEYRINPAWMAGGELVAPEAVPDRRTVKQFDGESATGDKLTPVSDGKKPSQSVDKLSTTGDTQGLSGDTQGLSGDTAMSPNPSLTINNNTPLPPVGTGGGVETFQNPIASDLRGLNVKRETAVTSDERGEVAGKPEWRWHSTRSGVERMGEKLGIGRWDEQAFQLGKGEPWPRYKKRVCAAYDRQANAARERHGSGHGSVGVRA